MEDKYVLKVRNPRGVRKEKIQGLTAPRISSIEGKKIAIMYTLPESIFFSNALAKLMQERFPTAKIDCMLVGIQTIDENIQMLRNYDAFVDGVRLSGGWQTEPVTEYEKAGIPGIHMCIETMHRQAEFSLISRASGIYSGIDVDQSRE